MDHGNRLTARKAFRKEGPLSVIVGVSGGIAAYKACIVVRLLKEAGHQVTVLPTRAALDLVGAVTWEAREAGAGSRRDCRCAGRRQHHGEDPRGDR